MGKRRGDETETPRSARPSTGRQSDPRDAASSRIAGRAPSVKQGKDRSKSRVSNRTGDPAARSSDALASRALSRKRRPVPARIMAPRLLFIGSVVFLILVGLVMIYSASSIVALNATGDPQYYLKRQLMFIAIGVVVAVVLALIPIAVWRGFTGYAAWTLLVFALLATAIIGVVGGGAQRWVTIAGTQVQPSELAKIACILIAASVILRWVDGKLPTKALLVRIVIYAIIPIALILKQPDMGTAFITLFGLVTILWLVRVPKRFFLWIIVAIGLVGVVAILAEPYRITRFAASFDPWSDPLGTGYQSIHALYAYGSGGLFGVGLGNSAQKFLYLPAGYTDFIFAIIGEELGLVGCLVVIIAFGVLVYSGMMIARNSTSRYGQLVASTLTLLIGFQALINIFQTIGLFPVTGKPLPFISYGGSSLLATMAMVGLILSVSFHTDTSVAADKRRDQLRILTGGPHPTGTTHPVKQRVGLARLMGIGKATAIRKDGVPASSKPTKVEDIDSLRRRRGQGVDVSKTLPTKRNESAEVLAHPSRRTQDRDTRQAEGRTPARVDDRPSRRQRAKPDRRETEEHSIPLADSKAGSKRKGGSSDSASHIEEAIRSDRRRRMGLRSRDSDSPDDEPPGMDG
jgi:cell division protein FtsW